MFKNNFGTIKLHFSSESKIFRTKFILIIKDLRDRYGKRTIFVMPKMVLFLLFSYLVSSLPLMVPAPVTDQVGGDAVFGSGFGLKTIVHLGNIVIFTQLYITV